MAEDGLRFVSKNGSTNNDGLTLDRAKPTVKAALASLPAPGGFTTGHIMIAEGKFDEDNPLTVSRTCVVEGLNSALGGFTNGTIIRRLNAGNLFQPSTSFTDWAHNLSFKNLRLEGNSTGVADSTGALLAIEKPGFGCELVNIQFNDSAGLGLHIRQGANSLHCRNIGASGCDAGGVFLESVGTGAFGFEVEMNTVQIDNCGALPFKITMSGAAAGNFRSTINLSNVEFETSSTGDHRTLLQLDNSGSDPKPLITVNGLHVIDGSNGSGKKVIAESGSDIGSWNLFNINCDQAEYSHLFDGVTEDISRTNDQRSIERAFIGMYNEGASSKETALWLGNKKIISDPSTSAPTAVAPKGSLLQSGNGNIYRSTVASTGSSTSWATM